MWENNLKLIMLLFKLLSELGPFTYCMKKLVQVTAIQYQYPTAPWFGNLLPSLCLLPFLFVKTFYTAHKIKPLPTSFPPPNPLITVECIGGSKCETRCQLWICKYSREHCLPPVLKKRDHTCDHFQIPSSSSLTAQVCLRLPQPEALKYHNLTQMDLTGIGIQ